MKGKSEALHPIYSLSTPWEEDAHQVWLASTLVLHRNFSKYRFPSKLDKTREHQVISLVEEAAKKSELKSATLYRSESLGPLEKEFLLEHYFITDGFHQAHGGEGFLVDEKGQFLGVINIEDHLQLVILDTNQELEKAWHDLIRIEGALGKSIDYAYDSRFGFLASHPEKSGTGLVISLFLHIPAVIHTGELSDLLEKEKEEEIEAVGLQGSSTEMIGDLLVVRNTCTTGLTEEYILTALRMWATRCVVAEIGARKKVLSGNFEALKNKVTRALGLLTHSYQLEAIEAINAFSLVKLGIELGWIQAKNPINLNEVFFNLRRAHLMKHLEKKAEIAELPKKRAEYLHEITKNLVSVIG